MDKCGEAVRFRGKLISGCETARTGDLYFYTITNHIKSIVFVSDEDRKQYLKNRDIKEGMTVDIQGIFTHFFGTYKYGTVLTINVDKIVVVEPTELAVNVDEVVAVSLPLPNS